MTKDPVGLLPQVAASLRHRRPFLWLNGNRRPIDALSDGPFGLADVHAAAARLDRFAPLLASLFPELAATGGIIESVLVPAPNLENELLGSAPGRLLVKCDHALPVAGSIKARGGIYEVLCHAEDLAIGDGLIEPGGDIRQLQSDAVKARFARHSVAVGSTGNLGLSIGIMAAALGFRAVVHMSSDAKAWKKSRLRDRGVEVVEHDGDFGRAVEAGRRQAESDPDAYFVDDEYSPTLFFGYAVAALRLKRQLDELAITVDADHPLFVYLPCGVGGSPGGILFGLRHLFGDHVHCFLAEPVEAPCVLLRLALDRDRPISVRELGLANCTEADGLAVAQASDFAAPLMRPLASGAYTVTDDMLFDDMRLLDRTEGLSVEPSAAAGLAGPRWLTTSAEGRAYQDGCAIGTARPTHIVWTTGGSLVPEAERQRFASARSSGPAGY